jgi:pyruvyltransferase
MKKLKMFYPSQDSNFGDVLTPIIFEKILGYEIKYTPRVFAEAIGIGSLLQMCLKPKNSLKYKAICFIEKNFMKPLMVMGPGFIAPPGFKGYEESFRRKMDFRGIRGKYSLERIRQIENDNSIEIGLGDPGLLASMLVSTESMVKSYKYGIIAHKFDMDNPKIKEIEQSLPDATLINVMGDPMVIMQKMLECEVIISSAMHGLIVSDSLSIPNVWISVSDKIEGGNFKFHDYYSIFDVKPLPIELVDNTLSEYLIERYIQVNRVPIELVEKAKQFILSNLKNS